MPCILHIFEYVSPILADFQKIDCTSRKVELTLDQNESPKIYLIANRRAASDSLLNRLRLCTVICYVVSDGVSGACDIH